MGPCVTAVFEEVSEEVARPVELADFLDGSQRPFGLLGSLSLCPLLELTSTSAERLPKKEHVPITAPTTAITIS